MFVLLKVNDARCRSLFPLSQFLVLFVAFGQRAVVAETPILRDDSSSSAEVRAQEIKLYANAHPYLDDGPMELKKSVPELKQLTAAASQSRLRDILTRAAAELDEPLSKSPNLVSEEVVTDTQPLRSVMQDPCPGMGACLPENSKQFNYILLIRRGNGDRLLLKEYRTALDGKPVPPSDVPHSQGFASSWLILSASNQPESHFRYLGEQKIDGRPTYVVAFAQIPGAVENPGYLFRSKQSAPMLLQGIAWISQSDYRITRIRTDLLEAQTEIGYQEQTAKIEFRAAQIPALRLQLWLPGAVTIETVVDGQLRREQHRYSKYRLYKAKSRIILNHTN